jgi:ribosome-associated protein
MISSSLELKDFIVHCLEEKKAENVVVLDLGDKTPLAKYMIFASGRSIKNISAIAEYIAFELKHKASFKANIESLHNSGWVLIDAGDIIVHVFDPDSRQIFRLEDMWSNSASRE